MFTLDPHNKHFLTTLEFLLKLIGSASAFYLFFIGLRRYFKDQIWKRNEFVAKEIKEFTSDKIVRNVMSILDWGTRYVELFPGKSNYDERFVKVDRQTLKSALQYHKLKVSESNKERFTQTEVAICDSFDYFLSYFERFEHFIQAGLITTHELEPYLKYWIITISEDMESDVRNFLNHYIEQYGYSGTQNFFLRFNKDIETTRSIEQSPNQSP